MGGRNYATANGDDSALEMEPMMKTTTTTAENRTPLGNAAASKADGTTQKKHSTTHHRHPPPARDKWYGSIWKSVRQDGITEIYESFQKFLEAEFPFLIPEISRGILLLCRTHNSADWMNMEIYHDFFGSENLSINAFWGFLWREKTK